MSSTDIRVSEILVNKTDSGGGTCTIAVTTVENLLNSAWSSRVLR